MIKLQYAGHDQGDAILWYPHAGHLFYFRESGPSSLVLERVTTCDGVTRRWDADTSEEDLPRSVKRAIADHGADYRERATTVTPSDPQRSVRNALEPEHSRTSMEFLQTHNGPSGTNSTSLRKTPQGLQTHNGPSGTVSMLPVLAVPSGPLADYVSVDPQ